MPSIPAWVEIRLNQNATDTLEYRRIIETMAQDSRPFLSLEQLQTQLDTNSSGEALRDQLKDLHEADIVASESYSESTTVYYINHNELINQTVSEDESVFVADSPLDHLSTQDFVTMRDTAGIRTLVLGGFQLTLVLLALGIVLTIVGFDLSMSSDFILWGTAFDLFTMCLLLLLIERTIRWIWPRNARSNEFQ